MNKGFVFFDKLSCGANTDFMSSYKVIENSATIFFLIRFANALPFMVPRRCPPV